MDEEHEIAKLKWLFFAGVAFLITGYLSYKEMKYAIRGKSAEATITRTFETTSVGRRGKPRKYLVVEYSFIDDDGKHQNDSDDVALDWPVPEQSVTVEYLPGVERSSRIEGHSNMFAVWMFLGSCALLLFAGVKLYLMAREAVHGKPRRRR